MLDYSTLTVAIKHLASYLLWMRSQYNTVNNKLYKHKHNITPPPKENCTPMEREFSQTEALKAYFRNLIVFSY